MKPKHYDVLIIGAGVAGIGLACHLTRQCPNKSLRILERRQAIGGTWDLFRYPGIRSDSDMFTFGYNFKPWTSSQTLADGTSIRRYVREAAQEHGVDNKITYGQKVIHSNWSSERQLWIVTSRDEQSGEESTYTAQFLLGCTGYYDYDQGYKPDFPGEKDYQGQLIHPQFWPENLDYRGKKVVVVGSGATAVTLVPAMANETAHITMLQRSPTYVATLPAVNPIVTGLQKMLPEKLAYKIARELYIKFQRGQFDLARKRPKLMRRLIQGDAKRRLAGKVDIKHFTPKYEPWDERLCVVPDGDLFNVLREGKASILTDEIERFTKTGLQLKSGQHIEADIVVTATGLKMQALGGGEMSLDDRPAALHERVSYKHMLIEGVPNALFIFGYVTASYTLRVDLAGEFLCRIIKHMDRKAHKTVTPIADGDYRTEHNIAFSLNSGYINRGDDSMPRQGTVEPWRVTQHYPQDRADIRSCSLDDPNLVFDQSDQQAGSPQRLHTFSDHAQESAA